MEERVDQINQRKNQPKRNIQNSRKLNEGVRIKKIDSFFFIS